MHRAIHIMSILGKQVYLLNCGNGKDYRMKITTKSKFTIDINPNKAKDWRFIKALAMMDSDDESEKLMGTTKAVPLLLGKDGERALEEHLSDETGAVASDAVLAEFIEIVNLLGDKIKKSSSSQE